MSLSAFNRLAFNIGKTALRTTHLQHTSSFSIQSSLFTNNRWYTDKHEWVCTDGKVGITDYAQDKLGEVVYVEVPEVGAVLEKSTQFATLESVKAVSECYTPISGKVIEVNESLQENPSQVNKNPFNEGWLIKLEFSDVSELDKLMNEKQYNDYLKSGDH